MWSWLGIFALNFLLDIVWAQYMLHTTRLNKWAAANWSIGIIIFGGGSAVMYVSDPLLLIPAAAGCWLGTFLTIDMQKFADAGGKGWKAEHQDENCS